MKKVIFAIPSLNGGGAEKVMINIANSLDISKFEVFLIVLDSEGPYKKIVSENVNLVSLKTKKGNRSLLAYLKQVNKIRPDIIFSTSEVMNILSLFLKPFFTSKPKIIVRLTNTPSKVLENMNGLTKIIFSILYKFLYPRADKIISQCFEMKKDFLKIYKLEDAKVKVIYNPINLKVIRNHKSIKNPYETNNINYLAVGRLTFQKGFDVLIQAFANVKKMIPSAELTILGNGEDYQKLVELSKKLGIYEAINFIDFVENPFIYYNYCDIFVMPSRWEGFPNALLEALACNCKVISTNCASGPTEIIGTNNKFGRLVEVENVKMLSEAMINELDKTNKSCNRAKKFNIEIIMEEYISLFENI